MAPNTSPRAWILVAGSGSAVRAEERVAAERLARLLAREQYGLIAGTWAGVDEIVTRAFLSACASEQHADRIVHIENSPQHSHHMSADFEAQLADLRRQGGQQESEEEKEREEEAQEEEEARRESDEQEREARDQEEREREEREREEREREERERAH